MSTDHHTPITTNAAANAAIVNAPLGELDAAINVEHETDGTHSADIIDQTQMALTAAAAADGEAARYQEFAAGHVAASGAHRTDVEIITAQAQVNLGGAAAAAGDAVRYNEYIIHAHPVSGYAYFAPLFCDRSVSAAADTPAAALPTYIRTDNNDNLVTFILFPLYKRASMDYVVLTGAKKNTSATLAGTITFGSGAVTTTEAVAAGQVITAFEKGLDISALADDTYHEFRVQMHITGAIGGATGQLELSNVQVWGAPTAPAPS